MVSFDAATMYGTKFEDMGTWESASLEEVSDMVELQPELWQLDIRDQHYTRKKVRQGVQVPTLTPERGQVSATGFKTIRPKRFLALTQPKINEVLMLIPYEYYYSDRRGQAPHYLQIVVSKMVFYNFVDKVSARNLDTGVQENSISYMTEIRNCEPEQIEGIKLLNWIDSSPLLDYLEVGPNSLRPFLWYLELDNGRPYGLYNPYEDNSSKGLLPYGRWDKEKNKVPEKAWKWTADWHKFSKMPQWAGDMERYQAETFNSSEPYEVMMAHDYTTLPKRGLCPICDGAIPNNENPGAYPGALSRFDNETYVCSACGQAEALTPMFSEDGKELMILGMQDDDWEAWSSGVLLGREPVDEMMDASKRSIEIMKETLALEE